MNEFEGGVFLIQCNYDINRLTISANFYRELLDWWSKFREVYDPENVHKYILWNNKEINIDGKRVFYKNFFENNIIYTTHLLFEMTKVARDAGLKNMDRFKAISSTETASSYAQLQEYP